MGYDRQGTEEALIAAVSTLLQRDGFAKMGVNAIAREAGVNKALIYRYFGGLEGLYTAFSRSQRIWPTLEEVLLNSLGDVDQRPWHVVIAEILTQYAAAIRARPITIDLLAWECAERNALTIAFESVREDFSNRLFAACYQAGIQAPPQVQGMITIAVSGIHYLAIRSRNIRVFSGVLVGEDAFWSTELQKVLQDLMQLQDY